jgi:hypothetical protein
MSYRLHPLYKLAREVSSQPIDWSNPPLARLQQEMRLDYMEHMHTLDLICTVVEDADTGVGWIQTLTDIKAQPQQRLSLDTALGEGRR